MSIAVGLGLSEFPFSDGRSFWKWVDLCEAGNVDSLWQTDRIVSRHPILECITTMAALAGGTKRIKFGMNVVSVGLRDPLLLAKQCATIDVLSGGRLLPAFGVGNSRAPEWKATSLVTKGRGKRTNEGLDIISKLWTQDSVDYDGEYFRYRSASIQPKPVQKNMPLWIGGSSDAAIRRTARFGTGWQAAFETPEEVGSIIETIKKALVSEGRTIADDHYGAGFSYRIGGWDDPAAVAAAESYQKRLGRDAKATFVVGQAEDIIMRISDYVDAGISKFILRPIGASNDDIFQQTSMLIDRVLPNLGKLQQKN